MNFFGLSSNGVNISLPSYEIMPSVNRKSFFRQRKIAHILSSRFLISLLVTSSKFEAFLYARSESKLGCYMPVIFHSAHAPTAVCVPNEMR
jgi:hypothetical protein